MRERRVGRAADSGFFGFSGRVLPLAPGLRIREGPGRAQEKTGGLGSRGIDKAWALIKLGAFG